MTPTHFPSPAPPVGERGEARGSPLGPATPEGSADDRRLVEALRDGDEAAFVALVDRYQASMIRIALLYVPDRAAAEDVVQEAWLGVLRGLDRFEARSSLKTWIFHILLNRAKTRAQRERRTVPFSTLWNPDEEPDEPAVDPARFRDAEPWKDHWASPPRSWSETPEARFLARETRKYVRQAVEALPPSQREVITLRDIEGWTADEVCNILEISETNQRVLLHRARSKVRQALERYLDGA
jgi:RNA polymerase sigma-70 factor, ECF subfamily